MTSRKPARRNSPLRRKPPPAVGLTGGIASGKSEVATVLGRLGAQIVSADREAKQILAEDPRVVRLVTELLGPRAYRGPGRPDRKYIAGRIFANPGERRKVNAIIHPAVIARIRRIITAGKRSRRVPMIVVEAALIFEAGMAGSFDAIIAVDAPLRDRIARIRKRDGITASEALRRVRSQRSNASKDAAAHIVITNAGSLASLREASRFVFRLLTLP